MDAGGAQDERAAGGRQKRVVLAPRRWGQPLGLKSPEGTGAKKPGTPRRARHKPKTIAQGVSDRFDVPVMTCVRSFHPFARKTAGAVSIRHSLRPPFFRGRWPWQDSGTSCRGNAFARLASQPVRARRRPMTGSAKLAPQGR